MKIWNEYFRFTRKERNGILVLIFLNIVGWTIFILFDKLFVNKSNLEYNQYEQSLKLYYQKVDSIIQVQNVSNDSARWKKDTCLININSPKYDDLLCIGINDKLARTWINYVSKGGKFRSIEDVKKLWGMNDSIYSKIVPYLRYVEERKPLYEKQNIRPAEYKIEMIELNSADTHQLKLLPGIGSSFANRIVKYRQRLGGYVSKEQLKEIYGLNEELFDRISPYIYVDMFDVKKININTSDYLTLIQHPYFNKEMVKQILQLRKTQGRIYSKDDLINHGIMLKEEWDRIKWYIEF